MKSFALLALLMGLAASAPATPMEKAMEILTQNAHLKNKGPVISKRQSCNTASDRSCWTDGFDLNTDYEASIPDTGVTRKYNLVITEHDDYVGGDGKTKKKAMLINGQFPGPVISADWGDWVEVTVTNNLELNGTSLHWHGIRMQNNSPNDGANGVTECPLAPGQTRLYKFRAEQYGTSWYHSHFSAQYGNGVVGSIQLNGPASANYDVDLGVFPVTDWYYRAADEIQSDLITSGGAPPASDNILINGSMVNAEGGGAYTRVKLTPGATHRLRIINPSVDNMFTVSLVGHNFTIIETDFVPIQPVQANEVFLGIGQRYDVLINADQAVDNYWFNVTFSSSGLCGSTNIASPAAIFQYDGASDADLPSNPGTAPADANCEDGADYQPVVAKDVPESAFSATQDHFLNTSVIVKNWDGIQRVYWVINDQDMNVTWDEPTLEYVLKNDTNYPARLNIFEVPKANDWAFWVIQNPTVVPHPMHLHGHDFYLLGKSPIAENPFSSVFTPFDPSTDTAGLRFTNPIRRDVTMMPSNGWVVLGFRTDNPGAWLFHCHIAWHVAMGLSVQFLERVDEIRAAFDVSEIEPVCDSWTEYWANTTARQHDSGLKLI